MHRTWAIVERELRRFRRKRTLVVMTLSLPLVQLVVLGYAIGGNVKHLKVGLVDADHGLAAVRVRELCGALASGAHTFETIPYADSGHALTDLRNGRINGVLMIPPGFSRRVLGRYEPRLALIEDNSDSFVSDTIAAALTSLLTAYSPRGSSSSRVSGNAIVDVVEVYPYIPYVAYLLPGSIVLSIFMMALVGGVIILIDDKARGLHEGYLATPITKLELVAGFSISGAIRAMGVGMVLMTVGSLIAGITNPFEPSRLLDLLLVIAVTAFALNSLMFLFMSRVRDPLLPRAVFGLLNTLFYFPSGAVYPTQGFPRWMQIMALGDPFTYAVHAFKCLLLKNTGLGAVLGDLVYLLVVAGVALTTATRLFRRTL